MKKMHTTTVGNSLTQMSAMNEEELDKLIVEIYDYAGKIKGILNGVEDIILSTESYFDCEIGNNVRNKFKLLSARFAGVSDNIISYAEDLVQVKTEYYKISNDLTTMLNKGTDAVQSKEISTYHEQR